MDQVPLAAAHELHHKLHLLPDARSIPRRHSVERFSIDKTEGLSTDKTTGAVTTCKTHLSKQPHISLQDASGLYEYLAAELITRDLNQLALHLWLVATQDSSALTHQVVRGREIIVTEKPELHLVWIYD